MTGIRNKNATTTIEATRIIATRFFFLFCSSFFGFIRKMNNPMLNKALIRVPTERPSIAPLMLVPQRRPLLKNAAKSITACARAAAHILLPERRQIAPNTIPVATADNAWNVTALTETPAKGL